MTVSSSDRIGAASRLTAAVGAQNGASTRLTLSRTPRGMPAA
jgi:hypothetical protein